MLNFRMDSDGLEQVWLILVEAISQTDFANFHLRLDEWGKAKVLTKKPRRTFISLNPGVGFNVIHHDLDEHATLPTVLPPCHSNADHILSFVGLVRTSVMRRACVHSYCWAMYYFYSCSLWNFRHYLGFYCSPKIINITFSWKSTNLKTYKAWLKRLKHIYYSTMCISIWD